ncbi:MAG: class I SAM-dependent methyltransferase [Spirulinaceae cyanobacterium SM2_1_0]|nr:class I SAM-dependent methyltransferase [Spirulinaceae cyanobacterium SM2_1_0]
MATILRDWSYRYQWLYDAIANLSALAVGGQTRFRQLALQGLTIRPEMRVLDLCCGAGPVTQFLVQRSPQVIGLDASPKAIQRARQAVPEAEYVEAFAEQTPFADQHFDLVHTSVALHEMRPEQRRQILRETHRILKPGGVFTLVDFHPPTLPLLWPGLALFLWLFETQTAWQLLQTDLVAELEAAGFSRCDRQLHAGGSLQVVQAWR